MHKNKNLTPQTEQKKQSLNQRSLSDPRNRAGGIPRWRADIRDLLCTECAFAVEPILIEFYSGTPIEEIEEQAVQACVVLDLYPEEVCRGTVALAAVSHIDIRTSRANCCCILTRAPLWRGGGGQILPPCRIFPIAQKRRQISTRNFQYLPQHQFVVCHQNYRKIRRRIFEKMAF